MTGKGEKEAEVVPIQHDTRPFCIPRRRPWISGRQAQVMPFPIAEFQQRVAFQ